MTEFDLRKGVARYNRLMAKARKVNAMRDKAEREIGFTTPDQGPMSLQLRTIMQAIQAGITSDSWDCIAEAQAMLEVIEKRERLAEDD